MWIVYLRLRFCSVAERFLKASKMAGYLNGDVAAAALSQLLNLPEAVDKLISPSRSHESKGGFDSIPVDIVETSNHYIFYMDVPGLSKSDIQVTFPFTIPIQK